jgi:hypothetical protein
MKKTIILMVMILAFACFSFKQKEHDGNQSSKAFSGGYTFKLS